MPRLKVCCNRFCYNSDPTYIFHNSAVSVEYQVPCYTMKTNWNRQNKECQHPQNSFLFDI